MTDLLTTAQQAAIDAAAKAAAPKVNVSQVCLRLMAENHRDIGLDEFTAACLAAGLNTDKTKVYASLQSLASTSKCDRGSEKQTWCAKGTGRAKGVAAPVTTASVARKSTRVDPYTSTDPNFVRVVVPTRTKIQTSFGQLVDQIKATLGRQVARDALPAFVICDDGSPVKSLDQYLALASNALGQTVNAWFSYRDGGKVLSHVDTADDAANCPGALHIGFQYRAGHKRIEADQTSATIDATGFDGSAETNEVEASA